MCAVRAIILLSLWAFFIPDNCFGCERARRWLATQANRIADYYYPPEFFDLPSEKKMLIKFGRARVFDFKPGWHLELFGKTLLATAIKEASPDATDYLVVGSGSGYIPIGLAMELEGIKVTGSEINGGAIPIAKKNAKRTGVEELVTFLESDLFKRVPGIFHRILFNAPRPMTKELLMYSKSESEATEIMKWYTKRQYRIGQTSVESRSRRRSQCLLGDI